MLQYLRLSWSFKNMQVLKNNTYLLFMNHCSSYDFIFDSIWYSESKFSKMKYIVKEQLISVKNFKKS